MNLILFILATIGATFITTQSYLFTNVRELAYNANPNLGRLLKCTQCSGFYWGIIIQFMILFNERGSITFFQLDWYYILYGFIGSLVSYTAYLLIKPLIEKYDK
jgi:hypothetical protein